MAGWEVASATNRGRVRRRNEDSILVRPNVRLFAVADGMGGHAAGNVASALAVATLDAAITRAPTPRLGATALGKRMREAFVQANHVIMERSAARRDEAGMGTTLTALVPLLSEPSCVIAHIGDSRAYRYRIQSQAPALVQLTKDHTWVQQQVESGALSPEQARVHTWSSILTRVLGMDQPGPADIVVADTQHGDIFLLCSDGLTGMLPDADIAAILERGGALTDLCPALIAAANENGGRDNISVILLRALS